MKVSQTLLLATCCVLGCQGMRHRNAGRRARAQLNNAERMKDPTKDERGRTFDAAQYKDPKKVGAEEAYKPEGSYTRNGRKVVMPAGTRREGHDLKTLDARTAPGSCTTRNAALTEKNANGGFAARGGHTAREPDCMYCVEPNDAQFEKRKTTSGCMYVDGGNSDGSGLCRDSTMLSWSGIKDITGCN